MSILSVKKNLRGAGWYVESMSSDTYLNDSARLATGKLSLRTRKQEFGRDSIWAAAIELFAEKGFEETTVDDIVDAAGTSRRTFFRYFESKRDLMAYPIVSYGASLAKAIESCPVSSSHAELFRHVVLDVAQRTVADSRTRRVMEIAARYPAAREAQQSRLAEVQDRVAEAFARRCKDDVTAHVLAGLTLSALSLSYRVWFTEGKKDIASAVEHVLAGISIVVCG
jgi:AcrR family transcriptional regulator